MRTHYPSCEVAVSCCLAVLVLFPVVEVGAAGAGPERVALRPEQEAALTGRGFGVHTDGALAMLRSLVPRPDDSAAIEQLIRDLNSESFVVREATERRIAGFGERARGELERALSTAEDPESRLRLQRLLRTVSGGGTDLAVSAALGVLDTMRPEQAVAVLLEALPHLRGKWNRREAGKLLAACARPEHFGKLLAHADNNSLPEAVRAVVVPALAASHGDDPLQLAELERLLGVASPPAVRLAVAQAFAEQGRRSALAALVDLLGEADGAAARRARHLLERWVEGEPRPPVDDPVAARVWLREHGADVALAHPLPRGDGAPIVGYATAESGRGVMRFGRDGAPLGELLPCSPYDAEPLPGGRMMVCERGEGTVKIFDGEGKPERTVAEVGFPTDAEMLPDGNILVLDNSAGQVVEVDPAGEVVWRAGGLDNPFDVDRLPDGNTLVADSGNGRLVEFDAGGEIVWQANGLDFPNNAQRLPDGNTLYTTYTSGGLVSIGPEGGQRFARNFDGATLYSVAIDGDQVHVSDGGNGCVYVLDLDGELVDTIALPAGFSDVGFVRE